MSTWSQQSPVVGQFGPVSGLGNGLFIMRAQQPEWLLRKLLAGRKIYVILNESPHITYCVSCMNSVAKSCTPTANVTFELNGSSHIEYNC